MIGAASGGGIGCHDENFDDDHDDDSDDDDDDHDDDGDDDDGDNDDDGDDDDDDHDDDGDNDDDGDDGDGDHGDDHDVRWIGQCHYDEDCCESCRSETSNLWSFVLASTTWSCVPPRIAIFAMTLLPVLLLVSFAALDKTNVDSRAVAPQKEHQGHRYAPLEPSYGEGLPAQPSEELSWGEKWSVAKRVALEAANIGATYLTTYLSNHGVITTISFSEALFAPRDHYPYYLLGYMFGKALGMSHLLLVSCTCPKVLPYVRVRKTWLLALLEVAILGFFVFDSWFRFVPHVAVILVLCVLEGFVAGATYVNAALNVTETFSDPQWKELGLALVTIGTDMGKLLAGLLGLVVEPLLLGHCVKELVLHDQCFTRYTKSAGWFENLHCVRMES